MPPPAKRRKVTQPNEITFDPSARQEYLTGFHKRKLQRKENAREQAVKREKEERVRERRQLREQRKEDLERHVELVNAELRKQNEDVEGGDGESDDESDGGDEAEVGDGGQSVPEVPQEEEEFVDEDKYTTVTVEPMGEPGTEAKEDSDGEEPTAVVKSEPKSADKAKKKKPWSKDGKSATKKKKRSFRYETKTERQATRQKQKSKNHAAKVRRTEK